MEELENAISTQAEENTVSLASAQALADALAKIEVYTPTTWVDNSSPDIDAEHLNKPEQAIKRVTDALNSAVDVIKDLQSQVTKNSGAISDVNNNLSNAGIPTVKKITDLYAIKKSGFYCYDAGASNAPMSSRGGMIVANYLSDSWISLTVVPYALSKIYTNTKYNNTWVGWAESATKDDLPIIGKFTNKKNKDIIKIGSVVKSRSVVCVFPRYNTLTTVRCIYPSLEISAGEDQFQLFAWDTNTQNDSTSTNLDGYYIVMPMLSK